MADMIRAHAWERTLLGPIEDWSSELVMAVNMILATKVVGTVYWGPERVMIYNDLYRPQLADRHPALGKPLKEVWPDVHEQVEAFLRVTDETGESTLIEMVPLQVTLNGRLVDKIYTLLTDPIWGESESGPRIVGLYHTAVDHTEGVQQRLSAERERDTVISALTASQEELAWTVQLSPSIPWTANTEGNILSFGEQWLQLTGLTREDAVGGEVWRQVLHPDDLLPMRVAWRRSVATGEPYDVEHRIHTASKGICWMRSRALPRRDETGCILRWYGTTEDINDQKLSQAALRESRARIQAIYDSTHEYLGLLTPDGVMIDCNRAALAFAENTLEDVIGVPFWESPWFGSTPGAADLLRQWIARAATGESIREQVTLFRPSGEEMVFDLALSPIRDAQGNVTLLVPESRDITELKRAEIAVMQQEKLAAVGRLAASIAHEINNPLESVTNLLYLARTSTETREIQEYLDIAERELRRVSVISNQTLRFYKQSSRPTGMTCESLIESTLSVYQGRLVNSRVQVEKRKRAHHPVTCFDGEIRQVLNNLVGNAIDAMHPHGGRLLIRSREGTNWQTGERGLLLTIADTGTGISPSVRSRMFHAFFTTKGIGGTGLGLWVSQEIVQRHQGALRARSSQKEGHSGTVFTLFLPFNAIRR